VGRLAILASGNGSNFEALALAVAASGRHETVLLACDRREARAFERAARLGIPSVYVKYPGRTREEAEGEILRALETARADVVALAGFMRILSPGFVAPWEGRLLNVHPSLLPRHPGAHAIERSWESGDAELGITVHFVDGGMDSGPVILQRSFPREEAGDAAEAESKIHALEHEWYPRAVLAVLDGRVLEGQVLDGGRLPDIFASGRER
jgi:phosphoribosylglycinamide formyltransferase 1